jgi:hypothetical protein
MTRGPCSREGEQGPASGVAFVPVRRWHPFPGDPCPASIPPFGRCAEILNRMSARGLMNLRHPDSGGLQLGAGGPELRVVATMVTE